MAVRSASAEEGAVRRLTLDAGKGNIIDSKLVVELAEAHGAAVADPNAAAVVIDAAGPHFSFGASLEEHRPSAVAGMLKRLHALIRSLLESPIPTLFAVKGQCLGGGLELVLAGNRIFAHPSAKLGQPEIKLAVFAPAGSVLLPLRIGQAKAEELLWSGRSVEATEALAIGLVDEVCGAEDDPAERALAWARTSLLNLSRSSLRHAVRVARQAFARDAWERIEASERAYLNELMATPDAKEGIEAFIEKRAPRWQK